MIDKEGNLIFYRTRGKLTLKPLVSGDRFGIFIEAVPAIDPNRTAKTFAQKGEKVYDYDKKIVSFLSLHEISYIVSLLETLLKSGSLKEKGAESFELMHQKSSLYFFWNDEKKVWWLKVKPIPSSNNDGVVIGFELLPRKSKTSQSALATLSDIVLLRDYLKVYIDYSLNRALENRREASAKYISSEKEVEEVAKQHEGYPPEAFSFLEEESEI